MNKSKQVAVIGFVLLLLGYAIFTTLRASSLQKQLNRLEVSYQELHTRHRSFVDAMLHADASTAAAARAKLELVQESATLRLREGLGVPNATVRVVGPAMNEVNSMPQHVTSK